MPTDIAFVVGVLALVGRNLPPFLPVFLVSLAIFDDLGAVIVVALFYGGEPKVGFLILAGFTVLALFCLNILGFRRPLPYVILEILLWCCIYLSGIHATVAGVILALTIPARSGLNTSRFADAATDALGLFIAGPDLHYTLPLNQENASVVQELELLLEKVEPPLQRIERTLGPWVSFAIMPLFALANCGISVNFSALWATVTTRASLGVVLGLVVGKQLGVFGATWLFMKTGIGKMPEGMGWRHVYGGALLCGIRFTTSLFIADLSLTNPVLKEQAKLAILFASLLSGILGLLVLRMNRDRLTDG